MDRSIIVIIGIAIALGLDLYGKAVCQGALLSHIDKKKLAIGVFLCGIYQLFVLAAGYTIAAWLHDINIAQKGDALNGLVSMVIFAVIGFKMLKTAWKNEMIVEKRQDDRYLAKMFAGLCIQIGFYTFLTGIGFGLIQIKSITELGILALVGIIGVTAGLISGYHFGYRQKTKAYAIGGGLLFVIVLFIGRLYL